MREFLVYELFMTCHISKDVYFSQIFLERGGYLKVLLY